MSPFIPQSSSSCMLNFQA